MCDGKNNSQKGELELVECLEDTSLDELMEKIGKLINQRKLTVAGEFESFFQKNTSGAILFQIGYTPNNLKKLIEVSGLSQKSFYEHLGKSRNAFGRYLLPVDDVNHVTMKHKDWETVLSYTASIIDRESMKDSEDGNDS